MSNTDKLREIARKHFPIDKDVKNNTIYNQIQQSKQDSLLSDLTALISEHYVKKDAYIALENTLAKAEAKNLELLRQRDELKEKYSKILEATSELLKSMKTDNVELKKSIAEMRINMAKEIAAIKNTCDSCG